MSPNNYRAICKPNQLIYGTGTVVVVTGWMPKERVAALLDPSQYAAIGGLVSPGAGIDYLVRNLLANPHVVRLVMLGCTRQDKASGSVDALQKFLQRGTRDGIGSDIPDEVLLNLRNRLSWGRSPDLDSLPLTVDALRQHSLPQGSELFYFPPPETKSTVYPGHLYGHRVEGKTIAETWVQIIHRIKTTGVIRPTGYDAQWQELINLTAVVTDEPEGFYFPEPNYLPCDREFVENYIPQILEDAPYQEGVKYTYAQRLRSWFGRDQIEDVIQKLIKEIDAASAVMSLWDAGGVPHEQMGHLRESGSSDHQHGGSPCLNHVWVRVVNNELSLTGLFRSNDMFNAWPSNAFGLRALQQYIRDAIAAKSDYDLKMGPLMTISQSAHIYDHVWEYADKLVAENYAKSTKSEYSDPAGNYLIEVEGGEVVVSRCVPVTGEVVNTYRDDNPLKLIRQIAADAPALQPDHAGYLGIEITKAVIAAKYNLLYTQDRAIHLD